jgi:23S rRNA pseudouridine955/2504/2580 synthase
MAYKMIEELPQNASAASAEVPTSRVSYVEAGEGDEGQRLDNFLMRMWRTIPKGHIYRLVRKGEVRINGKRAKPESRLAVGDRVRLPPVRLEPIDESAIPPSKSLQSVLEAAVIYEDRDLLIVNKPAGVAVHGGSGMSHGVIEGLRAARPELDELELVHRLDRETSGCLLIAKRRAALRELHARLRDREMDKRYLALVVGKWTLGTKKLDMPLKTNEKQGGERIVRVHPDGQQAESTFRRVEGFGNIASLMDVKIGTGRTHQIRVHAAYAGHPVAGDEKYGDRTVNDGLKQYGLRRMFLHAHSLSFIRPGTDEIFSISAPLSPELQAVLDQLAARSTGVGVQSQSSTAPLHSKPPRAASSARVMNQSRMGESRPSSSSPRGAMSNQSRQGQSTSSQSNRNRLGGDSSNRGGTARNPVDSKTQAKASRPPRSKRDGSRDSSRGISKAGRSRRAAAPRSAK